MFVQWSRMFAGGPGSSNPADPVTYGLAFDVREHSFLRNPRLPPALTASQLIIHLCKVQHF